MQPFRFKSKAANNKPQDSQGTPALLSDLAKGIYQEILIPCQGGYAMLFTYVKKEKRQKEFTKTKHNIYTPQKGNKVTSNLVIQFLGTCPIDMKTLSTQNLVHKCSQQHYLQSKKYVLCLITQLFCNPMDCSPPGSSVHGDSPGKNTGVGCQALP